MVKKNHILVDLHPGTKCSRAQMSGSLLGSGKIGNVETFPEHLFPTNLVHLSPILFYHDNGMMAIIVLKTFWLHFIALAAAAHR